MLTFLSVLVGLVIFAFVCVISYAAGPHTAGAKSRIAKGVLFSVLAGFGAAAAGRIDDSAGGVWAVILLAAVVFFLLAAWQAFPHDK